MDFIFYMLALILVVSSMAIIILPNPVYGALSLAIFMVSVAGMFFTLEAYFLAGVQLIVYAGAIVVLFVMVVMILDVKQEKHPFSRGIVVATLKIISAALIFTCVSSSVYFSIKDIKLSEANTDAVVATKGVALKLFTEHLFSFELIGVLLLVVLVGVLSLAKGKGGINA